MNDIYYWIVVIISILVVFITLKIIDRLTDSIHVRRDRAIEKRNERYVKQGKKLTKKAIRSLRRAYIRGNSSWELNEDNVRGIRKSGYGQTKTIYNICVNYCDENNIPVKRRFENIHHIEFGKLKEEKDE